MDPVTRYKLASCRLAALADPALWTARDLEDVYALVNPVLPPEEWLRRVSAPLPAQEPMGEADLGALIEGKSPVGKELEEMGALRVEVKTA